MNENIKEEKNKLYKKLFKNIMIAIIISIYFIFLNLGNINIDANIFLTDIKVFSIIILGISIIIFEKAYKNDSGELTINAIEILVLACHTLSLIYVTNIFKFDFKYYVLTSSYIFSIYYTFKDIIIYTRENRKYLKQLSDISDIVKKEKPSKKKATKKSSNIEDTTSMESKNEVEIIDNNVKEEKIDEEENAKEIVEETTIPKKETKKSTSKKSTTKKSTTKGKTTAKSKTTKNTTTTKTTKTTTKATANSKKKSEKQNDEKLEKSVEEENKPKRRGRPKKKVEE